MAKLEPVADVHKQASLSVSVSERHLRVQVAILVGRSGRLICYDRCVDQVAVTDKWHVPQSPETDISVIRRIACRRRRATSAISGEHLFAP